MRKPNLLFIYTDEQARGTLGTYGNNLIQTPNLDRFAEQATVFERAYVTQPVCTPSRSSLLTGLWPTQNGCVANNIPLRPDTPCLPELLNDPDYATGHFGKWHLGDEVFAQHGFQEWVSIEDAYRKYYSDGRDPNAVSDYHRFLVEHDVKPQNGDNFTRLECAKFPEKLGKPAFLAAEAERFIRQNQSRPFALYVNFLEPHMPFFSPRDDQYDRGEIPLPPNFESVPDASNPLKVRASREKYKYDPFTGELKTEEHWRDLIARYWGLCSLVDTHAGRILDVLSECGLDDDTIVVYTSDHGDMMGSHQLVAKTVMYEEAVTVPFMVRLPGQKRQRRIDGPVSQIDVVPTLLDCMGVGVPSELPGRSLKPCLHGEGPERVDRDVFIQWNGSDTIGTIGGESKIPEYGAAFGDEKKLRESLSDPVRTIVSSEGWKLNRSEIGESELYNLVEDPNETRNRHGDSETVAIEHELNQRIERWMEGVER